MLHGGWIDSLSTWYFTTAPALATTRHVLLYDLRGHGRSERPVDGYGLRSMAADLRELVDGFTSERIAVVGFSLGGAIAARFAVDHPDRVERLVLPG